jgi:hypothetical protein
VESRHSEILGLLEKGVFEITTKLEVLRESCIFNFKFVDKVKNKGTAKEFTKSRLVI